MPRLSVIAGRLATGFAASGAANVSVATSLSFIPFVMFVAAAVDTSNAVRIRAELQAAADAGVLAAATALASGKSDTDKVQIATDAFYANVSPKLLATLTAAPTTTVDFPAKSVHMTVKIETNQVLTSLFAETMKLGVQATAVVDKGSPICLLALNKTIDKALHVQGTADIVADGCAVHSNSRSKEGLYQNGSAKATAESFCVTGDYSGAPGSFTPKPRRSCPIEEDPLAAKFAAGLAVTDTTSCVKAADNPSPVKDDTTLKPGVYCGGFKIFKGTVTMAPGVYVFRDGEFEVRAGATLKGEGVTILLAGNSSTRFINQGGANVDISAPATGPFAGMVMAQLPDSIPSKENTITGGGKMDIDGIVYFPKQPLSIEGNGVIGDTTSQFAIMADTVSVQGTGLLTIRVTSDYQAAGLPELPESHETVRLAY